ncbi:hypothetical protein PR202_ga21418 [Eleusine coracana subsp. coracana]|uniref:P-type ATPase A domain-containing protein n=1 Tax=Eleusine coracana subsp. coracana TaxID=191504 RepID=A0AAV5D0W4_ELECO|nr:hypothetical protein PR202_ga21418 [Eleusine coracana subsp. coracana]
MAGRFHSHNNSNRLRGIIPRVLLLVFAVYAVFALYLLLQSHHHHHQSAEPALRTQFSDDEVRAPSSQKPWPRRLPSFLPWIGVPAPQPRSCEAYFGNGFSRRVDVVPRGSGGGWFRCHHSETLGSSICEGARVRLDPALIAMSRGGEPLEQVMGRAEEEELPKYEPGALLVEGPAAGPLVEAGFLDAYMPTGGIGMHTMRALLQSARVVPPGELHCSQWVEEPTLLVTRFEYANLFHTITDWYSAYVSSRVTDLPNRPNVVFVDGHCKDDIIASKKLNGLNVLFVRREDYLAHPRHTGKVESRLSNELEVYEAIDKWAKGQKCKINVINGLFAHMTMKEQLRAILEASVLIFPWSKDMVCVMGINFLSWSTMVAATLSLAINPSGQPPYELATIIFLLGRGLSVCYVTTRVANHAKAPLEAKAFASKAKVLRDGIWKDEDVAHLVPGDIIYLKCGDIVPANAWILNLARIDTKIIRHESGIPRSTLRFYPKRFARPGQLRKGVMAAGSLCFCLVLVGVIAEAIVKFLFRQNVGMLNSGPFMPLLGVMPMSMPAVLHLVLAVGSQRLSELGIASRGTFALEDLVSMDAILFNMTGTLTCNKPCFDKDKVEVYAEGIDKDHAILLAMWASKSNNELFIEPTDAAILGLVDDPEQARVGIEVLEHNSRFFVAMTLMYMTTYIDETGSKCSVLKEHNPRVISNLRSTYGRRCAMVGYEFLDGESIRQSNIGISVANATDSTKSESDLVLTEHAILSISSAV